MKKHFNEDLYYPIVALLMGVVRLLPDSGTWWLVVELVIDLCLALMVGLSLGVLLKRREEPAKSKPAAMALVALACLDFSAFAILQLSGVDAGRWNTLGTVCGLALGAAALVLTIVYLVGKKSSSPKQ